ncbi:hypothetical protein KFL_000290240 [Klebsormidium nitens]|uniref:Glycosyltransferase 2-like domain-containing protein n=1 Tax=Klebsormidium nitens TaxID=105231 RepID=A0A1Y1HL90_KLENI|nr:hypothetical protein KFL_000290240 [Klebsormidium nitens]|eukprot:GAQ79374.1 hypothetical protein KFL_000290240 [Klebsormidium nitens]
MPHTSEECTGQHCNGFHPSSLQCFDAAGDQEVESEETDLPLVSLIMPILNVEHFLDAMLASLLLQTYQGPMELSIYDDSSTDGSLKVLERNRPTLEKRMIVLLVSKGEEGRPPQGCGFGRNVAVRQCHGEYLCFADADDIMHPERIELQLRLARQSSKLLVGSDFVREPADATPRYTEWLNSLSQAQLYTQQLVECTIIHPTWFCSRAVYDAVGGYVEEGPGTPDDLIFFYKHLRLGGYLAKVEKPLVTYTYHGASVTGQRGVDWQKIWAVRVAHLETQLLPHEPWGNGFTIWNAGKEGKRLYRSLNAANQSKVLAFCDVDGKKLKRGSFHVPETNVRVPILHWSVAQTPLLLCVKRGLTGGAFERNLDSLHLQEGLDYVFFS